MLMPSRRTNSHSFIMADYGEHSDGQGADPTTPAKGTAGGATERDTALFCCVFKHMTNNPEVDCRCYVSPLFPRRCLWT